MFPTPQILPAMLAPATLPECFPPLTIHQLWTVSHETANDEGQGAEATLDQGERAEAEGARALADGHIPSPLTLNPLVFGFWLVMPPHS